MVLESITDNSDKAKSNGLESPYGDWEVVGEDLVDYQDKDARGLDFLFSVARNMDSQNIAMQKVVSVYQKPSDDNTGSYVVVSMAVENPNDLRVYEISNTAYGNEPDDPKIFLQKVIEMAEDESQGIVELADLEGTVQSQGSHAQSGMHSSLFSASESHSTGFGKDAMSLQGGSNNLMPTKKTASAHKRYANAFGNSDKEKNTIVNSHIGARNGVLGGYANKKPTAVQGITEKASQSKKDSKQKGKDNFRKPNSTDEKQDLSDKYKTPYQKPETRTAEKREPNFKKAETKEATKKNVTGAGILGGLAGAGIGLAGSFGNALLSTTQGKTADGGVIAKATAVGAVAGRYKGRKDAKKSNLQSKTETDKFNVKSQKDTDAYNTKEQKTTEAFNVKSQKETDAFNVKSKTSADTYNKGVDQAAERRAAADIGAQAKVNIAKQHQETEKHIDDMKLGIDNKKAYTKRMSSLGPFGQEDKSNAVNIAQTMARGSLDANKIKMQTKVDKANRKAGKISKEDEVAFETKNKVKDKPTTKRKNTKKKATYAGVAANVANY